MKCIEVRIHPSASICLRSHTLLRPFIYPDPAKWRHGGHQWCDGQKAQWRHPVRNWLWLWHTSGPGNMPHNLPSRNNQGSKNPVATLPIFFYQQNPIVPLCETVKILPRLSQDRHLCPPWHSGSLASLRNSRGPFPTCGVEV